jgi:nucleoside-diphosphate-sugar epimerase
MIISITGGTGFIGRRLVQKHLARGDVVRVLSRRDHSGSGLPDSTKLYSGDLSVSRRLSSFVEDADILYHCAGEIRDISLMSLVHVDGTMRLIEAATGQIGRWVQISSVGAYGRRRDGVITEQTELMPIGIYETSKVESENLVRQAALRGAFEHVILRPSNVYSTEMVNQSLFDLILIIQCGLFFYIGKPRAIMNYIHIDNVVEALLLCGANPSANGQTYNVSDYRPIEQFVATIADALKISTPQLRLPEFPMRMVAKLLGIIPKFPLSEARIDALTGRAIYLNEKIESELGYRHVVTMEAGLIEIVKFLQRKSER